jgi:ubiquinone/menaquinone biosynthesis C-methylase UbiE
MRFDYNRVAHTYDLHRTGGGPFLPGLVALAEDVEAVRVLEIGSGTGNNSRAFLEAWPCALTGVELSRGMIGRARGKRTGAVFAQADATRLPFERGMFDMVFCVLVLHHIRDINALMAECARVQRRGHAAFVTTPVSFIENHPFKPYFPSFVEIDLRRFQPVEEIEQALLRAGYRRAGHALGARDPEPVDEAYLRKIEGKFISTLDMIPADEFEEGLAKMRGEIAAKGRLDRLMRWEFVTVWACK